MMSPMPSSLRHLIAALLLVLLPLQAWAGAYADASASPARCSGEMMANGCCDHDDDAGAACRAGACFAAAAVAPPLQTPPPACAATPVAASPSPIRFYTSFIADGPQRPPCHHS